ncbi:13269_t:CDS:2 [Dentiscutata heterogama]|uniref:13269_t:CDS:1 n=1 Tax=Dentiscutata heterogama TaxID=1316150 RepID=A0ACA9JVC5_9GLOM|nr:13269_t:CDS:2 [Dentiscutata heterogama]
MNEFVGGNSLNFNSGEETLLKYSKLLESYLEEKDVKIFDYSQFRILKQIEKGRFAIVYLATFEQNNYALKSLHNNIHMDKEEIRQLTRELTNLYESNHPNIVNLFGISRKILKDKRQEIVDGTPSVYVNLFVKCWSLDPNERPTLNIIFDQLEKLSAENIECITNKVDICQKHDSSLSENLSTNGN